MAAHEEESARFRNVRTASSGAAMVARILIFGSAVALLVSVNLPWYAWQQGSFTLPSISETGMQHLVADLNRYDGPSVDIQLALGSMGWAAVLALAHMRWRRRILGLLVLAFGVGAFVALAHCAWRASSATFLPAMLFSLFAPVGPVLGGWVLWKDRPRPQPAAIRAARAAAPQ